MPDNIEMADNIERLEQEGVIRTPMPDEYEAVLRDLSDEEVDTLISVKKRLDEAHVGIGADADHYTKFLPF
jgi:hypothetical protein